MEYYSPFKKEILPFATTWMNPEGIMLSEITQRQKGKKTTWSHLYVKYKVKYIEAEGRLVVTRSGVGGGNGEILVKGYQL